MSWQEREHKAPVAALQPHHTQLSRSVCTSRSVLTDCCCLYTSEHQTRHDDGFLHLQDTDFIHHLHGSSRGWVTKLILTLTFLWFPGILGWFWNIFCRFLQGKSSKKKEKKVFVFFMYSFWLLILITISFLTGFAKGIRVRASFEVYQNEQCHKIVKTAQID